MEYRKLISFGKSSFVVSLPKGWVVQNKLKKGDVIYFSGENNNLILQPRRETTAEEEKEIVIDVDNKSHLTISREVCSAYILNHRKITLKGKEVKAKVKDIQGIIQGLIALEIMEQSPDAIVAKDFLDMEKVSMEELIRKMDLVTRTMFKEGCDIFEQKDNYESISERDKDVNRLYFLLYRSVLFNFENPSRMYKNFKLNSLDLLKINFAGYYIEMVADEVRRVARYTRQLQVGPAERKKLEQLLLKALECYNQTMKSFYNKDSSLALQQSEVKDYFQQELVDLEKLIPKVPHLHRVINRLERLMVTVHNLGRLVYTLH